MMPSLVTQPRGDLSVSIAVDEAIETTMHVENKAELC